MLLKPRNPHACSPLLKKGGAHVKTEKTRRQKQKRQLHTELNREQNTKGRCDFHSGLCFGKQAPHRAPFLPVDLATHIN